MPTDARITVARNPARSRFEVVGAPETAFLQYAEREGKLFLVHTEVAPALEGKGYAAALVREAVAEARSAATEVVALCPYAAAWLRRHPGALA